MIEPFTVLAEDEDLVRLVQTAVERFGRVDILVNNAAATVGYLDHEFLDMPMDIWRYQFEINVHAPFRLIQLVTPIMEKAGAKNIRVLVGLVAGQQTGTVVVTQENDDFAAAGAGLDRAFADPDIQKALALGEGNPMAGWQTSMYLDVPL